MKFNIEQVLPVIERALAEDIGDGDITTLSTVDADKILHARLIAKSDGVVAGIDVFSNVFWLLDKRVMFKWFVKDGDWITNKTILAQVTGSGRALLSGERTALNFLQRMSGIATVTRQMVEAVKGTKAVILDTRKTAPGLRLVDKWAVKIGGGENHRIGLFDMVLIKENHIAAAGGISAAVNRVRQKDDQRRLIEVEVKNLDELKEALGLNVDRILLDNMSAEMMREAVMTVAGKTPLEASGNITLKNIAQIAATGVDFISLGMLTHSVRALDVSFLIE